MRKWEKYLYNCFKNNEIFDVKYQNENENEIIIPVDNDDISLYTARPDFVIPNNIILDAKFVRGWDDLISDKPKLNASRVNDYNKCIRDMNMLKLKKSGAIFPTFEVNFQKEYFISKLNEEDKFYAIGICIPKIEREYFDWCNKLDDYSSQSFEYIKEVIKEEQ